MQAAKETLIATQDFSGRRAALSGQKEWTGREMSKMYVSK
jgi:hypothetical protein